MGFHDLILEIERLEKYFILVTYYISVTFVIRSYKNFRFLFNYMYIRTRLV